MSEESLIVGYLVMFGIVATGLGFYQIDNPAGPQLVGWSDLQTQTSINPLTSLNAAFTFHQNPNCGWDVGCALGNLVDAILTPLQGLWTIISWVIGTVKAIAVVLFAFATFSFEPPLPSAVQMLLWAFSAPFWFLVAVMVVKIIRGNEG